MATEFRVDLVEDDPEVREGLVDLIDTLEGFRCGVVVDSMEAYLWETRKGNEAGVVLMDIGLPGMSGIEGTRLLKEKCPELKIVMITINQDSEKVFEALRAGAGGYIQKSASFPEVAAFLQIVRDGGAPMSPRIAAQVVASFHPQTAPARKSDLSDREREVVTAIVDGLSYKQIGARLNISMGTVCSHITNIYKKLHINSKAELIKKSYDDQL